MWSSTLMCADSDLNKDLSGTTIIVTGGNTGIGKVTAMQLFKQGATVVIGTRKMANGTAVADELKQTFDATSVDERFYVQELDLADFESVRAFVRTFETHHRALHILVNNAGLMNPPFSRTKQGHEIQMGVNHIGPFLLTQLLTPMLIGTATEACPARVINTSSCMAVQVWPRFTPLMDWSDFHWRTREAKYAPLEAYGQSKLCNFLHALELNERFKDQHVLAVSLHPGYVESELFRHSSSFLVGLMKWLPTGIINTWEGAQTTLHCCLTDTLQGGAFYSQCGSPLAGAAFPLGRKKDIGWPCAAPPLNPNMTRENATMLWNVSETCIKDEPAHEQEG